MQPQTTTTGNEVEVPSTTQTRHPGRTTWRSVAQGAIALLPLIGLLAHELGIEAIPWVAATLAILAGVVRWMAVPSVNAWFTEHGLGGTPK